MSRRVSLVINPHSGGGRTGRRLPALEEVARRVFDDVEIRQTRGPGDGVEQAAAASAAGADLVIAVGGDGTANEVVNGLLRADHGSAFALVPAGTGSDLVRALGIPSDWRAAIEVISAAPTWRADVMDLRCTGPDGEEVQRFGINVAGVGMAGDVVERTHRSSKRFGALATFLSATLRSLASWRPVPSRVRWIDAGGAEGSWEGPLTNLFVNNGRFCGGGMLTGPRASMHDGLLDVVIIPELPLVRTLALAPHLYSGGLPDLDDVIAFQATELWAEPTTARALPMDVDGETPGTTPVHVRCLPARLPLCLPRI